MKGQRLSERTFELIKQMLVQGYSVKKVAQMLPEEIAVCQNTIHKINNAATYDEYCGVKPEPEKPDVKAYIPHAQSKEIVEEIQKTNIRLDSIFQMLKELVDLLK